MGNNELKPAGRAWYQNRVLLISAAFVGIVLLNVCLWYFFSGPGSATNKPNETQQTQEKQENDPYTLPDGRHTNAEGVPYDETKEERRARYMKKYLVPVDHISGINNISNYTAYDQETIRMYIGLYLEINGYNPKEDTVTISPKSGGTSSVGAHQNVVYLTVDKDGTKVIGWPISTDNERWMFKNYTEDDERHERNGDVYIEDARKEELVDITDVEGMAKKLPRGFAEGVHDAFVRNVGDDTAKVNVLTAVYTDSTGTFEVTAYDKDGNITGNYIVTWHNSHGENDWNFAKVTKFRS